MASKLIEPGPISLTCSILSEFRPQQRKINGVAEKGIGILLYGLLKDYAKGYFLQPSYNAFAKNG